jgi:hypothetical protein
MSKQDDQLCARFCSGASIQRVLAYMAELDAAMTTATGQDLKAKNLQVEKKRA